MKPQPFVMTQAILQPSDKLETEAEEVSPSGHDNAQEGAAKTHLKRDSSISERATLGLPKDLEDLILARLSISELSRVRCVCKRWNSLITHPPFLTLRQVIQGPHEATFFPVVFWNDGKPKLRISRTGSKLESIEDLEPIYPTSTSASANSGRDHERATWSWLGYDSSRRKWQTMKPFTTPIHVKNVITSSKGLLCLRGENSLLVLNPMTGSQRELPLKENVVQLVVDAESNSFQLICAASRKRTKVYDSQTGVWTKRGRPLPNLALANHIGAYCDDVLYCVAREERSGMWGVTSYDVKDTRAWGNISFFPLQTGETCLKAKVIQFGGEIFALVEKENDEDDIGPRTKSLSLWKLERTSLKWRSAGIMPTHSRQHLVNLDDFDCVALKNRICVLNKSTFKAVLCFISDGVVKSWEQFPLDSSMLIFLFDTDKPFVERSIVQFAFEPNLLMSL